MKLVSWNCRGLGGSQKTEVIKRIKSMEANSVLLIQETKKAVEDRLSTMKQLWAKGDEISISVTGASRGLLTWWDNEKFAYNQPSKTKIGYL